jgi:hypothetical protein
LTEKIINGDYVKNSATNSLDTVEYIEEVLQNVKIVLTAQRGKFYPNKNFGSRLGDIDCQPFCEYALAYANQALDEIDGVFVKNVVQKENQVIFNITINDEERQVAI